MITFHHYFFLLIISKIMFDGNFCKNDSFFFGEISNFIDGINFILQMGL